MIVGDKERFAIESGVSQFYSRLSFRALGFFVVYIGSFQYGVQKSDATMLACSFESVGDRIRSRGQHIAPFGATATADQIAQAFRAAFYSSNEKRNFVNSGIDSLVSYDSFREFVLSKSLQFAPDGDAAFDDGSYILHFDIDDKVRLIAFKATQEGAPYDPTSLKDVWLDNEEFYNVLRQWHRQFESEWKSAVG